MASMHLKLEEECETGVTLGHKRRESREAFA
jgi:hypothetical protein